MPVGFQEIKDRSYRAGARDPHRVAAACQKAVHGGRRVDDVIASVQKWQPELFGPTPRERQAQRWATRKHDHNFLGLHADQRKERSK